MNKKNSVKKLGASLLFTLGLIGLTYLLLPNGDSVGAAPQSPQAMSIKALNASARADQKQMRMALGQLPLSFEMNRGQFPAQVQCAARGAGAKTFVTQTQAVFVLKRPDAGKAVVRMSLADANTAPTVSGLEPLAGKINYFRGSDQGKWVTGVPTFKKVSYAAVYPGIDLVYYGRGNRLEYDLVVAAGADPSRIAFQFEGVERLGCGG